MKDQRASLKTVRLAAVAIACAASALAGAFLARGPGSAQAFQEPHQAATAGVKAPIAEVLHCPLAFTGVHLQKDRPANAQVAYHFCKSLSDDLSQCLLYDGTGPNARLLGIEYLVSADIYRKMPAEEQAYWHDHENEVDAGLLRSLTEQGNAEKATLAKIRTLYGKVFHTWVAGKQYPEGPAKLFWAVTGKAPFVLPAGATIPPELKQGVPPARP
jgi:hypothetical protein